MLIGELMQFYRQICMNSQHCSYYKLSYILLSSRLSVDENTRYEQPVLLTLMHPQSQAPTHLLEIPRENPRFEIPQQVIIHARIPIVIPVF